MWVYMSEIQSMKEKARLLALANTSMFTLIRLSAKSIIVTCEKLWSTLHTELTSSESADTYACNGDLNDRIDHCVHSGNAGSIWKQSTKLNSPLTNDVRFSHCPFHHDPMRTDYKQSELVKQSQTVTDHTSCRRH